MADPGTLAVKAVLTAASMAMTMSQKIEGPRLDDLDVTTADYGTPLIRFWGKKRLEGVPIMWAERLREKKTTSKTKGGKYSEYKYFGTFAVVVADHEIEAVTRIWLDKHLVYDATRAGPISPFMGLFTGLSGSPVKIRLGRNMRIYLGTETQEADERMESWCEDRYGANSCPAYRGVAYIVFEDLPLEKFGNRIPQVTVEAVNIKAGNYPTATVTSSIADFGTFHFSYDYSRFYHRTHTFDTLTRTALGTTDGPAEHEPIAVMSDGNIFREVDNNIEVFDKDGFLANSYPITAGDVGLSGAREAAGTVCFYNFPPGASTGIRYLGGTTVLSSTTDVYISHYFTDNAPEARALGGGNLFFRIYTLTGSYQEIVSSQNSEEVYGFDNGQGQYVIGHGDALFLVDKATFTVLEEVASPNGLAHEWVFNNIRIGDPTFWIQTTEISSTTLATIRTIDPTDWGIGSSGDFVYDPINHALIHQSSLSSTLTWLFLDRVTNASVTLGDVCEDVAGWCNITADTSALTQEIPGYSVTQGAGKDMIGPLLDIHDATVRPHDFSVQFINRGGAVQGTILTEDFVREGDEPRYTVTVKQDTDLPRKISLTFADNDKDQQVNTVISQRPLDAADTVREQQIDLGTYADTPSGAQQKLDRYFRRQWNERETTNNSLTYQYAAAEPGDSYTLDLDGVTRFATVKKQTYTQDRINVEWCRDALSFATLGTGTGAEMDGRDDEELYLPGMAKGFVFDIPLIQDADSNTNPLLYYGVGGYGSDFPGGTIYEADIDGDELLVWNSVDSADRTTWGICDEILPDANANCWDRGNTISVRVFGTLTSCTEADIDADPTLNLVACGRQGRHELLNFTTATLTGTNGEANVYDVSGFKRGRRGTEWATDSHAVGDEFVLLTQAESEGVGLSDVGTDFDFRAESFGRDPSTAPLIEVAFTGATLKPYAPARLIKVYDGTDLDCEIIRRTRIGGSWTGGSAIPLSENSEEYEVEVYSGATLKRTITVTGTNIFTYTAAMAATDSITLPNGPTFQVYQMSDAVGRGFALAA
jgi:hypothetical protein